MAVCVKEIIGTVIVEEQVKVEEVENMGDVGDLVRGRLRLLVTAASTQVVEAKKIGDLTLCGVKMEQLVDLLSNHPGAVDLLSEIQR